MAKGEKDRYLVRGKKRISVRLSNRDLEGLEGIRTSADLEDISTTVRWCIHFTVAILRMIPAAVAEGFIISEQAEGVKDETGGLDKSEKEPEIP